MASEFRILTQLDAVIQRTELLTQLLAEARQRVGQLESENQTLHGTIRDYRQQLKDEKEKGAKNLREIPNKPAESQQFFLNPKEMAKIVSDNPADMVSNAELKRKLDEYIQEIDRCIAHLSSLS